MGGSGGMLVKVAREICHDQLEHIANQRLSDNNIVSVLMRYRFVLEVCLEFYEATSVIC